MTKRTTDNWASLLDGATEGPWEWYWDKGFVSLKGTNGNPVATDLDVRDSDLAAAAPEAVAEVARLRRAIEGRIRVWQKVADKLEARGLAAEAEVTRIHANELTRTLEGDTSA